MSESTMSMLKRVAAFLAGLALDALDKKMGLNLDVGTKASITALVLGYIGQSMFHSVQKLQANADAAAKEQVKTVDDAVSVLGQAPKVLFLMAVGAVLFSSVRANAQEVVVNDSGWHPSLELRDAVFRGQVHSRPEIRYAALTDVHGQVFNSFTANPVNYVVTGANSFAPHFVFAQLPLDQQGNLATKLAKGEAAPDDGVFLPVPQAIATAQRIVSCEHARDEAVAGLATLSAPKWWVVAISAGVGALLAGGAVLYFDHKK